MPYLKKPNPTPEPIDCRILTAALELFAKNGFHTVSIHQIQVQASVSIGSIYNHFGGKEGIAKALFDHVAIEFDEVVQDGMAMSEKPVAQCAEIIRLLFTYTDSHPYIISYILNMRHADLLANQPSIYDTSGFIKISEIIKEGQARGEFLPLNDSVAFSSIFGSALRMIQMRLDGLIEQPLVETLDDILMSTFDGACTEKGLFMSHALNSERVA
ncbi:TetR/AcrR family transcriptional regulator [Leucothrix arctica]|uniref:TetR family transcriptional regulator n=1 Tax=Leucothrix arctica TaxID=1481894 RepID=A0A317CBL2_9GAMM|nr:TetR/AcrR family transcriptional regulator [Leucothrix arctica]PWQ95936.1 TetR family transcriptional regulator [Leucothrix arctica]